MLEIYNGSWKVAMFHDGYINEGTNSFTFALPKNISSGSYYVTLEMEGIKQTEVLKVEK